MRDISTTCDTTGIDWFRERYVLKETLPDNRKKLMTIKEVLGACYKLFDYSNSFINLLKERVKFEEYKKVFEKHKQSLENSIKRCKQNGLNDDEIETNPYVEDWRKLVDNFEYVIKYYPNVKLPESINEQEIEKYCHQFEEGFLENVSREIKLWKEPLITGDAIIVNTKGELKYVANAFPNLLRAGARFDEKTKLFKLNNNQFKKIQKINLENSFSEVESNCNIVKSFKDLFYRTKRYTRELKNKGCLLYLSQKNQKLFLDLALYIGRESQQIKRYFPVMV